MNKSKVSRLLYRFKSYHFTEDNYLSYVNKQVKSLYADTSERPKRRSGFEEENEDYFKNIPNCVKNIKDCYKNSFGINCPWIDSSLWDVLDPSNNNIFPKNISSDTVRFSKNGEINGRSNLSSKLFSIETRRKDFDSIKKYTSNSRRLHSSQADCFGLAGYDAALQLGIIPNPNIKFKNRRNVEESVVKTSKNTNSGWPFFKRKNDVSCIRDTVSWVSNFINRPTYYSILKNPLTENPTSLFHRVQPSVDGDNCNIKIRQVWCVPQRIIALEHYFFSELIENVKSMNMKGRFSVYSSGLTNESISRKMVRNLRDRLFFDSSSKKVYSLDYSKYDSTIPNFAIDLFFAIIKDHLDLSDSEDKAFECLRCYTRNTPLCYGNNLYIKTKGIMSGTYITNLFDTWFNLLLWNVSNSMKHDNYNYYQIPDHHDFIKKISYKAFPMSPRNDIALCGDDVLIYTDDYEISIHRKLCLSLGMKIEVSESYTTHKQSFYFLGRFWDFMNRPIQTEIYLTSHICVRTKFYNIKEVGPEVIKNLDLYRILSICLPFYNGINYIKKYLMNWKPMRDFLNSNEDFTLLKEWPNDSYISVSRFDAFNWKSY